MNQAPRPPRSDQKRPKGLYFLVGALVAAVLLFFGVLIYGAFFMGESRPNQAAEESATDTPPYRSLTDAYLILENNKIGVGPYTNLVVIVGDSVANTADLLVLASIIKSKECVGVECNTIDIWNSKNAYYLYKNKSDSPKWRKKHWKTVCESNVANYVVTVGELLLYPLMDSEYRRWGGKKKRPNISSYNL